MRCTWQIVLWSALVVACGDGNEIPPLSETGETGEPDASLPGGQNCGPNWYAIDGEVIEPELDDPDVSPSMLAPSFARVEFTAPVPPAVVHPTLPIDPSFRHMSHDEFVAKYADPYGRDWIVEGDQPMTDAALRALSTQLRAEAETDGGATPVAANYAEGEFDAAWSSGRKLALTWCIGRILPLSQLDPEQHEENFTRTIEAMEWATRAWERAGDVNFVHLAEFDGIGCTPGEDGVLFRVRTGPECLHGCAGATRPGAVPMFEWVDPADVPGTAEIIVGLHRFMNNDTQARTTALHELGHVMGFTHEHLRWQQDPAIMHCNLLKDIPWRGVTPPDPDSVMGYDDCVGIAQNVPRLSAWDRLGAYYTYTWGRRRSLLMGAVDDVDDYAYDGTGRTSILWQTSRNAKLELWTSTAGPGESIDFEKQPLCTDGGESPCTDEFDVQGRVRPVPAFLTGTSNDLDVLAHGPGPVLADALLRNDGAALDPWNIDLDGFAIPIVGSFGGGINDQIMLYRPGPDGDALLVADDDGVSVRPFEQDRYAYPLTGHFRGFGGYGTDILWYDPHEHELIIWMAKCCELFEFYENAPSEPTLLGLDDGVEYLPIIGDFDGDEMTDIFWYSAGTGADVMWWSESNQEAVLFSAAQTEIERDYQPFLGDFDASGTTDILWFAPYDEVVHTTSKIWYFAEDRTFNSRVLSTHRDYSPYVADFDDDGCSDIFWYKPDDPERISPIWRCVPEAKDFDCDAPQSAPAGSYPIGFGGAW